MPHGPTHGPSHTLRHGVDRGAIAGVTRDASSLKYLPANSTEWTTFRTGANITNDWGANPSSVWNMQEASGNLADSIGAMTLTAAGTPLYAQAVPGWTRLGVGFNGGATQRFAQLNGAPDPTTTSQMFVWFLSTTATPAGSRVAAMISDNAANFFCQVSTTPRYIATVNTVSVNGTANPTTAGIQPVILQYDRTNSAARIITPQEVITGTYSAGVLNGRKGIGSGGTAHTGQGVYGYLYTGANAEKSTAQIKSLMQAHGFTVAW